MDEALDAADAPVSLNQRVGSEDQTELGDLFGDPSAEDPAEEAVDSVRRLELRRALAGLPEHERRVLELRFGFDGEARTLEAIGKELGVTRERVRELESDALMHLEAELGSSDIARFIRKVPEAQRKFCMRRRNSGGSAPAGIIEV